jgi:hypothetical protein
MVMRALQNNVHELLENEVDHTVTTPAQKLARTQALFMYQIIRLFDGDIFLRAQAEKDMMVLHTWLGDLCGARNNLENAARAQGDITVKQAPDDWEVSSNLVNEVLLFRR